MTKQRAASIQWKTFWGTVAPIITGVWVGVWVISGAPTSWTLLATTLLCAASAFAARRIVAISPMFARLDPAAQGRVLKWLIAAISVYWTWSALAVTMPDHWPLWLLLLPALGGATWTLARVHEYLLRYAPPAPAPAQAVAPLAVTAHTQLVQLQQDLAAPRDGEPHAAWLLRVAITRAGLPWLRISNPRLVGPANEPFGAAVEAWAPIELTELVNGKVRRREAPRLAEADARRIALALRDITRQDIAPDWVQVTEDRKRVGVYTIQANTEDVMARIRPYTEQAHELFAATPNGVAPIWRKVSDPCYLMWGMDGMPIAVDIARHGWILGATTGGKSAYIHREWADLTRCEDAVIWVAGTRKLYDLVGPWLEPYLNQDVAPPLDWVVADPAGVLGMLIAAMDIARWRQDQPFTARRGFKKIFIYIDEASFALSSKLRVYYDGEETTAGQMYAQCMQAVASAGIYIIAATQRGVHHAFGDHGGDAAANVGREIVLMSSDDQEVGRVTGDYKLPPLQHRGECYARLGDAPHVRAKIEYVQTNDPSKPVLHPGPTVDAISWDRRYHERTLDAESAPAAGPLYAARPLRVTEESLADLRGQRSRRKAATTQTAGVDPNAPAGSTGDPRRDREIAVAKAVADVFADLKPPAHLMQPAAGQTPAPVTPIAGRRNRADRVEDAVRDIWTRTNAPATIPEILTALQAAGDDTVNPQLLSNALSTLARSQPPRVTRARDASGREVTGQYLPPEAVTAPAAVTASS